MHSINYNNKYDTDNDYDTYNNYDTNNNCVQFQVNNYLHHERSDYGYHDFDVSAPVHYDLDSDRDNDECSHNGHIRLDNYDSDNDNTSNYLHDHCAYDCHFNG